MAEGDASHVTPRARRSGRLLRRTTGGLVVAVLASAVASYHFELGDRLGLSASRQPARVAVAPPLELPAAVAAAPVAAETPPRAADPAAVRRAVSGLARARKLGPRVSVAVAEPGSEHALFASGVRVTIPASTLKLLPSVAALQALGPDHRFTTTVVRSGRRVVLVGGGDPLLTRAPHPDDDYPRRADLTTLARTTASALHRAGLRRVRLGYDASLFTGPAVEPTWEPGYVPDDEVSPITSLWVDEGRERDGFGSRSDDPARDAARFFATALATFGVRLVGPELAVVAPTGGIQVASVSGPPLSQVVQRTLELSDNEAAEVLARHVALATGEEPSFRGASRAVRHVLGGLGVRLTGAVIQDGSGLSRADRLHYTTLLDVLGVAVEDPRLRTAVTGLPVAGYNGSLASRFETAPREALGEVRAKTGTLTGVSGLAGTVVTRDGVLLAFVAIADRIRPANTLDARARLDELAGALAACTCAA